MRVASLLIQVIRLVTKVASSRARHMMQLLPLDAAAQVQLAAIGIQEFWQGG